MIDLFEFTTDPRRARLAVAAGVTGLVVDWEQRGKAERQAGADTQINQDGPEDLARLRESTTATILCRVEAWSPGSPAEIDLAVTLGADGVLLPMVRTPEEVGAALTVLDGRAHLAVMVETCEAVDRVEELLGPGVVRAYVGLNDLMIDRGSECLFEPLVDGTAEAVAVAARRSRVPLGLAGLTRPEGGRPVPCRLLIAELTRLGVSFTFLRRSFQADVPSDELATEVPRLLAAIATAERRSAGQVLEDRAELVASVAAMAASASPLAAATRAG